MKKRLFFLMALASFSIAMSANIAETEPNDDSQHAQELKVNTAVSANLGIVVNDVRDQVDWYRIDLPDDGTLDIQTTTETTLRLGWLDVYMMDADGNLRERKNKDMDANNKDTTIVFTLSDLAPGTYYIKVNRYDGYGGYVLKGQFIPSPYASDVEPNDESTQAQDIVCGQDIQGRLGYSYLVRDQVDWYRIDLPDDGTMDIQTTTETTLRLGRLDVYMMDADGNLRERKNKDMDANNKDTTIVFTLSDLAPGTYYIKVNRYDGYGGYVLKGQFIPSPYASDVEPNDESTQAQDIACGQDIQGRLGYSYLVRDQVDWYRIDLPDDGTMDIQTTTETTLRLGRLEVYMMDADGNLRYRTYKDMDAYNKDTTIVFTLSDLAQGTYYIKVNRYDGYGGYVLKGQFIPSPYASDVEPNDESTQAQDIACGQDIQGRLGYCYLVRDQVDWYRIDIPADGTMDIQTTAETTLRLGRLDVYMMDADGNLRYRTYKDMDAYNKDTTIVFTLSDLAPGTYYIKVNRYDGYGGYMLNCAYTENPYYTGENGYSEADPRLLTYNKTDYATLGYQYINTKHQLWYSFSTSKPVTLEIQPDTTKSLVIGVVEVYKKNADGSKTRIYSERLERTYRSFEISEPGDYLVYVPRYGGSNPGYGGVSVKYGNDESGMVVPNSPVRVSVEGRNTVRKGVPCQNTIVVRNTGDKKTGSFFLAIAKTDDIRINKINLSDIYGRYGEDMMYEDICNSDSSIVLYFPSLDPFEDYRVLVTSEGVGDIDYVKAEFHRKSFALSTAIAVAVVGFAVDVCIEAACDWGKGKLKENGFELNSRQYEELSNVYGTSRQHLEENKYKGEGYGVCVAKKGVQKVMEGVMTAVPGGSLAMTIGDKLADVADLITCMRHKLWYWIYKDIGLIPSDNSHIYDAKVGVNGVVASWDPNEMVGPQGTGDERYIGDVKTVDYTIMFENKAEAGAPAYRVRVTDELDPEVFDVNSVRFGATSHDGMGYSWKMTRDGNKLSWDIEGIELPPNKVAPEGEGYVTFSVNLKPGLPDGTKISNKATIIFDKNTPIETNVFTNVLDLEAPSTTMLSAEKSDGSILVKCQSADAKSGVDAHALYVSKDNGAYELVGYYPNEETFYTPIGDGEYSFYVMTVDNAGNAETVVPRAVSITTDVEQISAEGLPVDHSTYDLFGRKVEQTRHGIYIQNGRKVLK